MPDTTPQIGMVAAFGIAGASSLPSIFAWQRGGELIGLSHPGVPEDDAGWIAVAPETDPASVLSALRTMLGEPT